MTTAFFAYRYRTSYKFFSARTMTGVMWNRVSIDSSTIGYNATSPTWRREKHGCDVDLARPDGKRP